MSESNKVPPTGSASVATVYLVGAGPGDPGLLTVAAADALRRAAVVVYDYLANAKLLELCPASTERIYVGKSATRHTMTQDQINALLVEKARAVGKAGVIVRLKGGDPYVFGRGGEEGEFLWKNGVLFEVIPGITAGLAGPAYAGIPVTHRNFTSTITLVTGHEKEEADPDAPRVNYEALAALNGTLVFYMGVKSLPLIVERLTAGGLPKDTPATVVRWATHPHQQTVVGTLETIAGVVEKAKITAPAITVIGRVVSLRETLNWFEQRPLFGQTVVVTRTRQQASELAAGLSALGARVLEAPTIEIVDLENWEPVDASLGGMSAYDWVVFTSANGVETVSRRLRHLGFDSRSFGGRNVAAIGPATARALEQIGIVADLIPEKFVGEELAAALREVIGRRAVAGIAREGAADQPLAGSRLLLLRAEIARPVLRDELVRLGARVDDVPVYQTVRPKALPDEVLEALRLGEVHWVTFTSASTATNFFELLPTDLHEKLQRVKRLSIGPITSAQLIKSGFPPTLEAARHDVGGMIEALSAASKEVVAGN